MVDLTSEDFDELVAQALNASGGTGGLDGNVAVFVEDQAGSPRLLGLYEGVPLTARGHYYSGHLPDRITIFRKPIQRQCVAERIVEQVRITVVHEVVITSEYPRVDFMNWDTDSFEYDKMAPCVLRIQLLR